ncbi:MAG: SRPBCC domain-containing protein [Candidatus Marinimicrobia bacterium]|nr:SRPBCC domain-containing protein [FCB group bacterium]MBL7024786.1 SRPBCC domain-containing protein [Candidatus Neomarinimicrobiota bacterium]
MREIRTEIEINASQMEVWDILMAFDKWSDWNPTVNQASGTATLGSKVSIIMAGSEGKNGQKYSADITTFEAPRSFRWRAVMMAGFLMTNDRSFELEPAGEGTKLINTEHFSGLLVSLLWSKLENFVPDSLKSMNEALKRRAEKT